MKKILTAMPVLLSIVLLLNSCSTGKNAVTERKTGTEAKENAASCFVQLNDGTIKNYTSLKLITGMFKAPHLLADGKTRINASQIKAYQNEIHYAVSQNTFCCGRKSYVAVETLPGFAVRIIKGKLNVFVKKFFNGQHAVDEFFLQAGSDGQIVPYTPETMSELVKSNQDAYNLFNNNHKRNNVNTLEKIQASAYLFNNADQFISKN
jgi:hypothetical protein